MSWRTFEWAESPGTAESFEPMVEVTRFMSGYESRAPIGLQDVTETHDLTFDNISTAVADDIRDFIRPGMGSATFLWTPLGREDALVVKCTSYTRTLGEQLDTWTIRLRFEQVFEPIV